MISLPIVAFALLRTPAYMARAKLLLVTNRSYLHLSPQDSKRPTCADPRDPGAERRGREPEEPLVPARGSRAPADRHHRSGSGEPRGAQPRDRARDLRRHPRHAVSRWRRCSRSPSSTPTRTRPRRSSTRWSTPTSSTTRASTSRRTSRSFFAKRSERLEKELRQKERRLDRYQRRTGHRLAGAAEGRDRPPDDGDRAHAEGDRRRRSSRPTSSSTSSKAR